MSDDLLLAPLLDDIARLRSRASSHRGRQPMLDQALRNLEQSIEELQVASEELQVKNEELLLALSELDVERRRYRELFDNAANGFLVTDEHDVLVEANRTAGELTGQPAESLTGRRLFDLFELGSRQELARQARRVRQEQRCEAILTLIWPSGEGRLVRVLGRLVADGQQIQWTLVDLEGPILESETATEGDAALVRRWLGIYGELVGVTESLLAALLDGADGLSPEARQHLLESEAGPIEARLVRLRRRRDHWARRHEAVVGLELDMDAGELRYRDRVVPLTHREQQLMRFLVERPGAFFAPRALLTRAWHASYLSEEQLRTYVARLRRKLEDLELPCELVTRRHQGYALIFND